MNTDTFARTVLAIALVGGLAACQKPADAPTPSVGRVVHLPDFPTQALVTPRPVSIWLPTGYDGKTPHQVLYMHDGQMLYDSSITWNGQEWGVDEALQALIDAGEVAPTIVVGIWNGGPTRHIDYFPQRPWEALPESFRDSLLREGKRANGQTIFAGAVRSDAYLRYLVEVVKPYVDSAFVTLSDAAHTFVAGSSMGGLISMYALCEYPDVYGGAACLSTHWPGVFEMEGNPIPAAFRAYMQDRLPVRGRHRLYFDYGTATLDALYPPLQAEVDSVLVGRGYSSKDWQTLRFEGADHSENAWRARLATPLRFLLAPTDSGQ